MIKRRNLENNTALHFVVTEWNLAIVINLGENGTLLHHQMFEDYSVLNITAQHQNLDILEYLLQRETVGRC